MPRAGHTLVQAMLEEADPVHKVTIIPRGQAMGATFSLPERDRYGYGLRYLSATMRVLCGGRITEERKTGDISSGASMDIQMATNYARHMVLEWGMSERLGFVRYSGQDSQEMYVAERDYSPETARIIDEEIEIDEAYDDRRMIDEHWTKVEAIAGRAEVRDLPTRSRCSSTTPRPPIGGPPQLRIQHARPDRCRRIRRRGADRRRAAGRLIRSGPRQEPSIDFERRRWW